LADINPKVRQASARAESGAQDRLAMIRASAARRLAALPQRDERPDAFDRLAAALHRREESERRHEAMIARWQHKNEGTPETHEKANALPERRRQSPLHRMERLGKISSDERAAAEEIAGVAERIRRAGSIRSVSLETRVDFANSGRDQLVESLKRIRLEIAYRAWCDAIPQPRAMVLDMVLSDQSFVQLARAPHCGSGPRWPQQRDGMSIGRTSRQFTRGWVQASYWDRLDEILGARGEQISPALLRYSSQGPCFKTRPLP
jgi:hypothetical protein